MVEIGPLNEQERDAWQALFRGYNEIYQRVLPQEGYDRAWREFREGARMHALGARIDGRLVGITHFLVHPSTSSADVCYLQDLFTSPEARGRGVARALIEAVVDWARERECARVYWHTQETNATARRLYDQVALNKGFIQYQVPLD
ncbi:GNAT family N-acetyltransferase [Crossiella sp. SN42]|uniref:GNAT family N-acetyltransferase n=1 Tax=Crossiella sp. SN42 TaxID=2944808 RepID=UPI00207D6216|nr:GNAT family N-acetyltransferase [Crossiella sp. SN42]MCO1575407.1 GNAT family N-acetyltransferase [Crossiella sp. SN42]